jgi:predicted permease
MLRAKHCNSFELTESLAITAADSSALVVLLLLVSVVAAATPPDKNIRLITVVAITFDNSLDIGMPSFFKSCVSY